ncbi:cupin domain-containing protein [Gluconobacter morbifer]|uniref:Cupin 2 conserved barrel domain-containing protein n=1 Tax=Gluconobacter morbifer G707 TaxID=1088869 RepID=G6XMM2_9PROT|nr:hypothetical protein [Gluconobacter morbifer]EHH66975.1 hypothetical protein GMO_27400 [Gluconobacter morbifer G707]
MFIQKRLLAVLGALSACATSPALHAAPVEDKPSFPTIAYWDNWTDSQGVTHLTKCRLSTFHEGTITPTADKVMFSTAHVGQASEQIRVQPPHWKGGWNRSRHVEWVVPLWGTYFVQAMDGTSVELNAGDILLSEDLNASPDKDGHTGHLSGNVGDAPVALQITRFEQATPRTESCKWQ